MCQQPLYRRRRSVYTHFHGLTRTSIIYILVLCDRFLAILGDLILQIQHLNEDLTGTSVSKGLSRINVTHLTNVSIFFVSHTISNNHDLDRYSPFVCRWNVFKNVESVISSHRGFLCQCNVTSQLCSSEYNFQPILVLVFYLGKHNSDVT